MQGLILTHCIERICFLGPLESIKKSIVGLVGIRIKSNKQIQHLNQYETIPPFYQCALPCPNYDWETTLLWVFGVHISLTLVREKKDKH